MSSLREITEDILALETLLWEMGGDVTDMEADDAIARWLEENQDSLETKLDGYATLITQMQDLAVARRDEAKRLTDLARTGENGAKRLKDRLAWFFQEMGIVKVEAKLHRIWLQRNGGKTPVDIADERLIPDQYKRQVTTTEIDTDKVRKDLEAGKKVPGATLLEKGFHIRVK